MIVDLRPHGGPHLRANLLAVAPVPNHLRLDAQHPRQFGVAAELSSEMVESFLVRHGPGL